MFGDLSETVERLRAAVKDAPVEEDQSKIEERKASSDLIAATIAVVLEKAPEGTSAEEIGNALGVALAEAAHDVDEDHDILVARLQSWLGAVSESVGILSESLKE